MGIQLDWQIESDSGWQDIGEDPHERARRLKRARRLRALLIVALVASVLVGGTAALRLQRAARQRQFALQTAVAAETASLRVGDEYAFLNLQIDDDTWRESQRATFQDYAALGGRLLITGDILSSEIEANRARVTLREILDGDPYLVYWHYEYTSAGWRHILPVRQFWGESLTTEPAPLRFTYYEADAATAGALREATRAWVCHCNLPPIEIRLVIDPGVQLGMSPTEDHVLLVPSPLIGRAREDGQLDPALLRGIADALAGYYARARIDTLPPQIGAWERAWQEEELHTYLRHRYNPEAPPSIYLDPLIASSRVFARSSYAVLLASINDTDPEQYPEAWNSYLTGLLAAENTYWISGSDSTVLNYVDPPDPVQTPIISPRVESLARPGSIEVIDVEKRGRLYWAEVRFQIADVLRGTDDLVITYEPFVERQGRIYHTQAVDRDWGDIQEQRSAHVILRYYALDEAYARGLLATLEAAFVEYVNDLSLSRTPPVVLASLSPYVDGVMYSPQEIDDYRPAVWFVLRSPYVVVRDEASTPAGHLEAQANWKLRENLYDYFTHPASSPSTIP